MKQILSDDAIFLIGYLLANIMNMVNHWTAVIKFLMNLFVLNFSVPLED